MMTSGGILRCQETLGHLEERTGGLYSRAADRLYPVVDDIVFMGYDEARAPFFEAVLQEEREHQTSPEYYERDLAFIKESSLAVVALLWVLARVQPNPADMRSLEVGAASSWVSFMFAEQGYDAYACELEPNSLAVSALYKTARFGVGKRIVSDATLVPFADNTFDLVICKEFAHHVKDKLSVMDEAHRVLRPGGFFVMLEPTKNLVWDAVHLIRPDPHTDHANARVGQYLGAIDAAGFDIVEVVPYHYSAGRFPLTRRWRRGTTSRIPEGILRLSPLDRLGLNVFGGSIIVVAKKVSAHTRSRARPRIRIVSPENLTITAEEIQRYAPFREILERNLAVLPSRR
jgi:SAM-dependent methyltransferase